MVKYVIKRLLLSVLIIFGVSIILYALLRCMPLDYIRIKFGNNPNFDQSRFAEMEALYGLDSSILGGYIKWMFGDWWMPEGWFYVGSFWGGMKLETHGAITFDFGNSFQLEQPVTQIIADNVWISFILTLVSLLIYYPLAVYLGTRAAVKQYGAFDYATTVLTMIGISFPSFFFAAIVVKIFAYDLGWFDTSLGLQSSGLINPSGWELFIDQAWHLVLPILVTVVLSIGSIMRYTRTNMLEVLNADYIRTARAKGLSERSVIYKHAFKNTMIPMVTMLAGLLPGLFGGSMILEQFFGIPGIGLIGYTAMNNGDIPLVMGYNMFLAVLTVLGMLLTDIMYVIVDPRVKLTK